MATFGNTNAGANGNSEGANYLHGGVYTLGVAGTVTDIYAYMQIPNGVSVKCTIYRDSDLTLMGTTSPVTGTGAAAGWVDFPISGGLHLAAATYQLIWNANGNYTAYNSGSTGGTPINSTSETYDTWPNPGTWTHASSTINWSIYGLYTADVSGTTLDGQALTVTKWGEDVAVQASQWDAWSNSTYKRKVKVYGIVRTYIINCIENAVAWASSLVNRFETTALNGNTVVFSSDQAVRPVSSVNVYVLDVSCTLENIAGQNVRKFTLTLQEAQ